VLRAAREKPRQIAVFHQSHEIDVLRDPWTPEQRSSDAADDRRGHVGLSKPFGDRSERS